MGNKSNGQKRQKRQASASAALKSSEGPAKSVMSWKGLRDMASAHQVRSRTSWQGLGSPPASGRHGSKLAWDSSAAGTRRGSFKRGA